MKEFSDFLNKYKSSAETENLVIFGAGTLGRLTLIALNEKGIKVNLFCDSDVRKQGKNIEEIKIIGPEELEKLDKNSNIFICAIYFSSIVPMLEKKGFKSLYKSTELLEQLDVNKYYKKVVIEGNGYLEPLKLKRDIDFYNEMGRKNDYISNGQLNVKSIDVQITEKCSLKCKDCSNLMQYYQKAEDTDQELLFKSIDKIMDSVDSLGEFRVLGGDPFMYKKMHEVVNKLVTYDKCKKVVIYTNGRIVPKGENLECLRHKKVMMDITNYGESSTAHSKVVELAKRENLSFTTFRCNTWSDCGRIIPYSNKSEKDIKHLFNNCCNSDLVSLLHGKLYRCPFSANGVNLKAIPQNKKDEVDLNDDSLTTADLREQIKKLCYEKEYLTACYYCNGRDYSTANIPSALQTKKPLEYNLIND
jgi:organic radical activating enzyme